MERVLVTPIGSGWVSRPRFWFAGVVGAAALLALFVLFPRDATIPPSTHMSSHRLPELGIQFDYPSNWHLQTFDGFVGMSTTTGALVSNVDHDFQHPDLGHGRETSAWDMRGLSDGLVLISFEQHDRHNIERKFTRGLPLALDDAVISRDAQHGVDVYGAPQPRYFLPFQVGGHLGSGIQVYIGEVGRAERAMVDRILASVEPLDG